MRNTDNRVKENVHMENELRKIFNAELPKVKAVFAEFIGQKVLKVDETHLVKKLIDKVNLDKTYTIEPLTKDGFVKMNYMYLKTNKYSTYLSISLCFSGGNYDDKTYYCEYRENQYCICDYENGVITKIMPALGLDIIDANIEQINYDAAQKAKDEYNLCRDALLCVNRMLI